MSESVESQQELAEIIEKWKKKPYYQLNEGNLVRLLDQCSDKECGEYTGELKAMVAAVRYERKKEWDVRIDQWLTSALEEAPSSLYAAEVIIDVALDSMNEPWFQEELPKIRETDHSQGKKNKIDKLLMMVHQAKAWYQELTARQGKVQSSLNHAVNTQKKDELQQGLQLLNELGAIFDELLETSKAYRETISGIYSSKEKKEKMDAAVNKLQKALLKWESWREEASAAETTPLDELNRMIGIEEVKRKVESYYYYLEYEKERQREGYHFENERNLNMILTGNPGTGKTSIARLLAKIYHQLGVLPRENVVEVDRSHLVGAYVGQTEEKTMGVIQEAAGGVLFIDEAYSLKRDGASAADYGQTAVDTLVSAMTSGDYAGKFAVILAGYPEEMRNFLWSNPGLRSRFPETNHIHLPDFSMDELMEIAEYVALDNDFSLTESALKELEKRIDKEKVDENFGNARAVKNIVLDAIFQKGAAVARDKNYTKESFTILDEEAFKRKNEEATAEKRSGEDRLTDLVGLKNVKEQVKQLSSFVKIQKEREEKGLPSVPVQLHAVFSGPPGTGKTTVAHIYSQILHELGLLKRGHVVIAGRSDLVAGYVGQTAAKTKKKIREALGGVLFIDEAYSLLAHSGQDFGREAVDTLVEEMTKHGENLVVILAGYSGKMDQLLSSNPGLSSRFKKTIEFSSYTPVELTEILHFYVNKFGYDIDEDTSQALENKIKENPPEGNARAMKDQAEEAIQRQAYRLVYTEDNEGGLSKLILKDFPLMN
ncbi:AAA family ATPase [Salipaludibacillus sp. CUR1]|uniref:AAA family ATPase n=1 Tax=Salipaludibacillus sp. CUR1 TaxID=2820003 RepID=UPI001E44D3E2|nr:AAA family ATPase [Salipaludibacillus sp. CUR1]MCE7791215.1 AAA family ATPase [Salipaludibacillus sp. CUR1]